MRFLGRVWWTLLYQGHKRYADEGAPVSLGSSVVVASSKNGAGRDAASTGILVKMGMMGFGCGRGHMAAFSYQTQGGHNDCHGQQARIAARVPWSFGVYGDGWWSMVFLGRTESQPTSVLLYIRNQRRSRMDEQKTEVSYPQGKPWSSFPCLKLVPKLVPIDWERGQSLSEKGHTTSWQCVQ